MLRIASLGMTPHRITLHQLGAVAESKNHGVTPTKAGGYGLTTEFLLSQE